MSTTEKSLNLRVDEALGWKRPSEDGDCSEPPDYLHDWSVTGPLIDKYGICISQVVVPTPVRRLAYCADAYMHHRSCEGSTTLEAVCNLLIAMAEAGVKL